MRRFVGMSRRGTLGVLALLVVTAVAACGQPAVAVDRRGDPGVPAPRTNASSGYDAANGTIVMFGGADRTGNLAETWTWDGAGWRRQHPAHSPPAREHALMAFDPAQSRVVLFGGQACPAPSPDETLGCDYSSAAVSLHDTWLWDGRDWSPLTTAHVPDIPYYADDMVGAADDSNDKQLIVVNFTKLVNSASAVATWTLKDGDWLQLHPQHAPPDLLFGGPSFDSVSGRLIVQQSSGGHVDCGSSSSDCAPRVQHDMTWSWDGADWHDLGTGVGSPHEYGRLVEAGGGGVLLVGDPGSAMVWNGKRWSAATQLPWGSALRTGWTAAYDAESDEVVLFGGRAWGTNHLYGDTEGWKGSAWTTLVSAPASPSIPLAQCDPRAAIGGYGGGPSISPTSVALGIAFFEPKAGPCHLDVVVQFSLTGPDGKLLPVTGNPSQVELVADLTFEYGFEYATFTITNACRLPPGAIAKFGGADLNASIPAIARYCADESGPVTITAGTLHRPDEK